VSVAVAKWFDRPYVLVLLLNDAVPRAFDSVGTGAKISVTDTVACVDVMPFEPIAVTFAAYVRFRYRPFTVINPVDTFTDTFDGVGLVVDVREYVRESALTVADANMSATDTVISDPFTPTSDLDAVRSVGGVASITIKVLFAIEYLVRKAVPNIVVTNVSDEMPCSLGSTLAFTLPALG
jgi:hypothetical protein